MYGPPGGGGYPGQPQDPWQGGSDPYGGQPGGDPYGGQASSPFGNPPGGDPYGQQPPQDPYGQPPPQDPYGQPPQHDPYGQPPQHDPYGQPSGPPAGDPWGAPAPPPMSGPPGPPMGPPMGGQQWAPPPPQKSNAGLIIGLAAAGVFVLLIGAVLLFVFLGDKDTPPSANPSTQPSTEASPTPSETETSEAPTDEPTKYDLADAEEGDCLYDSDPSDTSAQLTFISCDERGTDHYEVLKRFDDTQDADKCKDVDEYDTSFTSSSGDFVLCVKELV
ncbi:MAG: LppU/SCO3897 family protein [Micromonosporaceae bacterium]